MINMVLCGGSGTRLWPISRTLMPKQFVKLFDERSLFQLTVKRNQPFCSKQMIVSNAEQYFLASDQLEELESETNTSYLLEPVARNTAPAIALACLAIDDKEDIVLVTPSDHLIKNTENYALVVEKAKKLAQDGNLVTFGITPEYAETGYGYIEADGQDVKAFHEKPDAETAQSYLDAGNYYWNSGMFCFKAGVFLEELKTYSPEVFEASCRAFENAKNEKMIRIGHEDMAAIPEDSIDYAVMEKSKKVKVVASAIDWSDLGSFDALYEELDHDDAGNALLLAGNMEQREYLDVPITENAKNNLIISEKQVAAIDVEDLFIVDTADALLVTKKGSSQKVKEVVKTLKKKESELPNIHVTAHRPWGTYTILDESNGYKVKRIVVKPGKRLSLQKHFHRSEHWVVVSGTAQVTRGNKEYMVRANESTFIPMGEMHRLENLGKNPLVMIEAQVGEYVGEDDIVRIEDEYIRK